MSENNGDGGCTYRNLLIFSITLAAVIANCGYFGFCVTLPDKFGLLEPVPFSMTFVD